MYTLKIENEYHSQLELTHNETKWQVTSITGLNPPAASISSSVVAGFDGERFNSSRLDKRNIVISFVINTNVEANRMLLNSIIFPKRYIKVYYKNSSKDLYIEGYVESFEYDIFSSKCACQLSIICPTPFWIDNNITSVTLSPVVSLLEFPFSIPVEGIAFSEFVGIQSNMVANNGNIQTGIEIELEAMHNVIQPTIMNVTTGENMTIETELQSGDRILISTIRGNKYVKSDCNCVESNLINNLTDDSKWIQLIPGQNRFSYSATYGSEYITLTVKHRDLFGGV